MTCAVTADESRTHLADVIVWVSCWVWQSLHEREWTSQDCFRRKIKFGLLGKQNSTDAGMDPAEITSVAELGGQAVSRTPDPTGLVLLSYL